MPQFAIGGKDVFGYRWDPALALGWYWGSPDTENTHYWLSFYGGPYSKKYIGPFWGVAISPPWKRKASRGWFKLVFAYWVLRGTPMELHREIKLSES